MTSNTESLTSAHGVATPTTGGRAARWARDALVKRLEGLQGGSLVVNDGRGQFRVGDGAPDIVINVLDSRFYTDVLLGGSLGAGGSYIDNRWETDDLPGLLRLFTRNVSLTDSLDGGSARVVGVINWLRHKLRNNTRSGSRRNIRSHYDLGNDFFAVFLDPTMTYSAGVFESQDTTMEQASTAKLDRICKKLALQPGHQVLEIGTGWGSFALHAARHYNCHVTTTTVSKAQYELAVERVKQAGLADRIQVLLRDYRDLEGRFDRLVSIEMIEAVGNAFLPQYFSKCTSLLREDGAMALQAITMPDHRYRQYLKSSDFIREHVFPGSCCPSVGAMQNAIAKKTDLKLVQLEDIGLHYATTLRHWRKTFLNNHAQVIELGYPERLTRLWDFYLAYSEAGFAERYISNVQLLLHKPGCRLTPPLANL